MKRGTARAIVVASLVYIIAGIWFGALSGRADSHRGVVFWRLAAWVVSAVAFGAQIAYEQIRLRSSPRHTALHAAEAAAVGALALAVAANIHSRMLPDPQHSLALGLSLVIWPLMTLLPAFLCALAAALVLARARRSR